MRDYRYSETVLWFLLAVSVPIYISQWYITWILALICGVIGVISGILFGNWGMRSFKRIYREGKMRNKRRQAILTYAMMGLIIVSMSVGAVLWKASPQSRQWICGVLFLVSVFALTGFLTLGLRVKRFGKKVGCDLYITQSGFEWK